MSELNISQSQPEPQRRYAPISDDFFDVPRYSRRRLNPFYTFFRSLFDDEKSLFEAIQANDKKRVLYLLEKSPNLIKSVDSHNLGPLIRAIKARSPFLTKLFLSRGADINSKGSKMNFEFFKLDFR